MSLHNGDPQMILPPWQEQPEERVTSATRAMLTKTAKSPRERKAVMTDARGVAEMLQCDLVTVWKLLDEERLPAAISVGGQERWRVLEIKHWVKEGCPDRRTWERRYYSR